jgi:hypothetical protein
MGGLGAICVLFLLPPPCTSSSMVHDAKASTVRSIRAAGVPYMLVLWVPLPTTYVDVGCYSLAWDATALQSNEATSVTWLPSTDSEYFVDV